MSTSLTFLRTKFPILIVDQDLHADNAGGRAIRDIIAALADRGLTVMTASDFLDGAALIVAHPEIGVIVLNQATIAQFPVNDIAHAVKNFRSRYPRVGIFLDSSVDVLEKLPMELISQLTGFIYKLEDTATFIGGRLEEALEAYLDKLLPPFFKELMDHTEKYKYSWHTPGHSGGVAFLKSPVGRAFFDFFGESTFRSDLSVSVPELGSLLEHTSVVGEAEHEAALNFGADRTYFVTNGTSTANKMVWHGSVSRGDLVVVDRNCHKSILHSIIMTGSVPVYFRPTRNPYGIIGPIPEAEFTPEAIQTKIDESPLIKNKKVKPRLAVVTNSTYDGLCYNAPAIRTMLAHQVEVLHFDEAWFAYARFSPFYEGRYGMAASANPRPGEPVTFTTHSTHKLLAALSQSSMIHVKNNAEGDFSHARFNEAFMMHTSTSPQYSIIASCDVASRMMAGGAGRALIEDAIAEAMAFRRKIANTNRELKSRGDWFFNVWQPEKIADSKTAKEGPLAPIDVSPKDFVLKADSEWHGFKHVTKNHAMLDPIKVTVLTPGLDITGELQAKGIPAGLVSRYLWRHGLVVEKTGLYSFLVLFSIGITKGKWGTLLTELFRFKELYDLNAPLDQVYPDLFQQYPAAYAGMGLQELAAKMHAFYREHNTLRLMGDMYTDLPTQVTLPCDAYDKLVRNEVEQVPMDQLADRIPAVMLVPYPPGIPVIMPGEKFDKPAVLDYLKNCRDQYATFPGFETEIHGLEIVRDEKGMRYEVCCLKARKS
ncbi:Orn/Lys/Arg decarboxylase N-terminal domain-containing protein [Crenobacter sp. SG2305]|uniref:Orn/Lys/Arg family decarboxylase n=1 Tax=Crenobacter oryzisoli TaxID=3056844 RepID=UPI0025AA3F3C|nr:Orn/Lys/Arg decarboxylase N-terminal domain-containing protein [Crenobacter sp. SG2305]MDN0083751.1 Orn/Lys/Arg decarboxylase N-terminal domain-containing protein [Crenobacter sp. SG2305]